ncbi:MAG TPA: NADH-quinone oxidoreductase subunit G [Thiotrichaceae bacterium]|jgi:NADH-quinone oxidoreductase subunit G|nr:NADH-quinone oxidoreductase subunit G [Thiotrichaceae bacterium]HIM07816.1 NADH-quinone oxidoreductase subunit G [Gammaproteobacteria bacterium]
MPDEKITIEVDGQTLTANKGQMLIEVTDANDIYVPRFCYHNKLTIAANCRMCLVEVEKAPKSLPACATPVMEGMKVKTRSKAAIDAQKSVMEFLLINHPLDCPICDQGGECELQDLAMGYGEGVSRYQEKKRVVKDKNIGPLIHTDLTRCIHCTRCVRFGEEIAGLREMGATGRGENMQIGTYIEKSVSSEMSGNIIDLCPVGALTSKPFRYSARTWELVQKDAIAAHDSVGSNIHIHVKGNEVKRVVPAHNEDINEVWLSDRDRFSYEAIYSDERLQTPMIKEAGSWHEVDWETALDVVKNNLQALVADNNLKQLGAIASPSSTLEELYLLQKLIRAIGSNNIDSRLKQSDFSDQDVVASFPYLGQSISEFDTLQSALLIGSNVRKDQPIINHRLRKAVIHGASVMVLNPVDYDFNYPIAEKSIVSPGMMPMELASILKVLVEETEEIFEQGVKQSIDKAVVNDSHRRIANNLLDEDNAIVLLGNLATAHPQFSLLRSLAGLIAKFSESKLGYLSENANSSGAWLAGAIPHRLAGGNPGSKAGMNTQQMLQAKLKAYVLMGVEPELDCWDSRLAQDAMKDAKFVVSLTAYRSEKMNEYADVLLPISVFTETSGTYINNEGASQSFAGVVSPLAEARPAWKVLRVLGNCFELDGFNYQSSSDVLDEAMQAIGDIKTDNMDKWQTPSTLKTHSKSKKLQRITETPMNMIDAICRRAVSLQQTKDISDGAIHINSALANKKKLTNDDQAKVEQGENSVTLKVIVDDRIADDCVLIQSAHPDQIELGAAFSDIRIEKSKC